MTQPQLVPSLKYINQRNTANVRAYYQGPDASLTPESRSTACWQVAPFYVSTLTVYTRRDPLHGPIWYNSSHLNPLNPPAAAPSLAYPRTSKFQRVAPNRSSGIHARSNANATPYVTRLEPVDALTRILAHPGFLLLVELHVTSSLPVRPLGRRPTRRTRGFRFSLLLSMSVSVSGVRWCHSLFASSRVPLDFS